MAFGRLLHTVNYFGAEIVPYLASGSIFKLTFMFWDMPSSIVWRLTLWHTRMFQAYLVPIHPSPGINDCSEDSWFILVGNGIKSCLLALGVLIVAGVWHFGPFSAQR